MPLSCDELTERWKASAAASELKAVKQHLQIVLNLHSLVSSCLLTTIWLQYCRFCTIWCRFLLGFFYKLGCIISWWFFPISWLLIGACAWADTTVCRQVPDICKRAQYSFQDNNLKFCLVRAFSNHNSKACLSRNRVSFIMIWTCTWPDFISTHN